MRVRVFKTICGEIENTARATVPSNTLWVNILFFFIFSSNKLFVYLHVLPAYPLNCHGIVSYGLGTSMA